MTARKQVATDQSHLLNQKQVAKSLGVSISAFQKWNVRPTDKRGREALYLLKDILENRLNHQAETLRNAMEDDGLEGLDYERLRLTRAQADNMEIKNEIARGKTAPIEIIQMVLSRVSGEAAGELDSIPLNIKRKNPELDNQIIEDIKRHCVKAQNAIARCDEVLDEVLDDYIAESEAAG